MASEHPRAARPHVGRQVRSLIGSSHCKLWRLLFAPATRVLAVRYAWSGWDDADRERHLEGIIGLARFRFRPSVSVKYLVSRVLAMAARQVATDFEESYRVSPVLIGTLVGPEHTRCSLRAAGWRQKARCEHTGWSTKVLEG